MRFDDGIPERAPTDALPLPDRQKEWKGCNSHVRIIHPRARIPKANPRRGGRRVLCVETQTAYPTVVAAAKAIGRKPANIFNALDRTNCTAYGFTWRKL